MLINNQTHVPCVSRGEPGFILFDALIGILIFSIGILGLAGFQAATIKMAAESNNRANASYLAEQLIGQMWADIRTTANLQGQYNSPAGPKYIAWKATVAGASTGLPGVVANPPSVIVDANNQATIAIFWQSPGDVAAHRYVITARINDA